MPREPILTLPAALTAYVALLAVIHLRVLLPPEWEDWTVDVFGFIPKRYDATMLNIDFPGGTGAKVASAEELRVALAQALAAPGFSVIACDVRADSYVDAF